MMKIVEIIYNNVFDDEYIDDHDDYDDHKGDNDREKMIMTIMVVNIMIMKLAIMIIDDK